MLSNTAPLTVVCYARPTRFVEPIDAHIETLQQCEEEGRIGSLLLRAWPAETSRSTHTTDETIVEFERFQAWADRAGVSICPPFEQVTRTSSITGERQELLRTPLLCLALYLNDQLVAVYPHTDGAHTHSVTDVIATLRTGELPAPVEASRPTASTPIGRCPECETDCQSGQGLYACLDCHWVAESTADGHYQDVPALQTDWEETARPLLHSSPQ